MGSAMVTVTLKVLNCILAVSLNWLEHLLVQGRSQDIYGGAAKIWTPTGDLALAPALLYMYDCSCA